MSKKNTSGGLSGDAKRTGLRVCRLCSEMPVVEACRIAGTTPASLARWLRVDAQLAAAYKRSCEVKARRLFDDTTSGAETFRPPEQNTALPLKEMRANGFRRSGAEPGPAKCPALPRI